MPALLVFARLTLARLRVVEIFRRLEAIDPGSSRVEDLDDPEILRRLLAYEPVMTDVRRLQDELTLNGSTLSISARRTS